MGPEMIRIFSAGVSETISRGALPQASDGMLRLGAQHIRVLKEREPKQRVK
jgi:hypothetical protein